MEHTLKFKYKCLNDSDFKEFLSEVRRQYTICIHYLINRLIDTDGSLSEKRFKVHAAVDSEHRFDRFMVFPVCSQRIYSEL